MWIVLIALLIVTVLVKPVLAIPLLGAGVVTAVVLAMQEYGPAPDDWE